MNEKPLDGKVAIITGAGGGIGRELCLKLAANGASIALDDVSVERMQGVKAEVEALGGVAEIFPKNIGDINQCVALVEETVKRFGRLDILVNNATAGGTNPADKDRAPKKFWETPVETLDTSYFVNVRAPFVLSREAVKYMEKQAIGHIVNIGAVQSRRLYPGGVAYSTTKNAMRGMTIVMSKEIRKNTNIRISILHPAGVNTPWFSEAINKGIVRPDLQGAKMIAPHEIADAVMFLVTRCENAVVDELGLRRLDADYWLFE